MDVRYTGYLSGYYHPGTLAVGCRRQPNGGHYQRISLRDTGKTIRLAAPWNLVGRSLGDVIRRAGILPENRGILCGYCVAGNLELGIANGELDMLKTEDG